MSGVGSCWCGFSAERAKAGGPNHIEAAMEPLDEEPLDEETGKCLYCNGRWDPVRDWREYIHEATCPWPTRPRSQRPGDPLMPMRRLPTWALEAIYWTVCGVLGVLALIGWLLDRGCR